ncbi:MAG: SiaC family regulatory phosphoprotein [Cyclobacteriaceae bacterium]
MRTQLFTPSIHQKSQDSLLGLSQPRERLILRYMQKKNMLLAMGRSVSLDVRPAYQQIFYQVKRHFMLSNQLTCYFYYTVINATTTKLLFSLFRLLNTASKQGNQVTIFWMIEDGDQELREIGTDFKEVFSLDFKINVK